MKKQLLLLVMILLPMVASADPVEIDGIYYNLKSQSNVAEVTSNPNKYTGSITIPESVKYNDVPYNVTTIGEEAFRGCTGLTSITIPNSVTSIGKWAISGCTGLTSITIPNSVTSIGDYAISRCTGLTSITISNSVTKIGFYSFYNCTGLTSITIPNSVTYIDRGAFVECTGLTSITIPNSVTTIDRGAFEGCISLSSVRLPDKLKWIGAHLFKGCKSLKTIVIPNGSTSIGTEAFMDCKSLESVTIPPSINNIGYNSFLGCNINAVYISDLTAWCNIRYEEGPGATNSLIRARRIYLNGEEIKDLVIPNTLTVIKKYSFYGFKEIKSVTIPNTIQTIEEHAFDSCSSITNFTIPNSVTSIGNGAFSHCENVTTIEIPNSLTTIGEELFLGCTGLTSINIPNGVTNIGRASFSGCTSLTSINIPEGVTSIQGSTFSDCTSLTSINIPEGVTSIAEYAFSGCKGLNSITIPDKVVNILAHAFEWCSSAKTITLGSKVDVIGYNAFSYCNSLADVYCLATETPNADTWSFTYTPVNNVVLHVPKEAISLYQSHRVWSQFKDIIKIGKPQHMLTYVIDGEVYKIYKIEEDETITPEPAPTKEGYTFSGWSEIPATMPDHDVTVTGTFSVNKYKLNYKVDGEDYRSYQVVYGATITPEPAPTKEGHIFSGWSEIPATMPAHDVTVTGTFTIEEAVVITANSYSRQYGEANPTFEYTSSGATLTGTPAITCEATATSAVGEYDIVVSKGSVTNYNVTFVNGKLTVTKAPLTITAKSYTIKQGDALPTFEAEYAGFKNNETSSVLSSQPTITTTATSASEPGTYDITVSGAAAGNYDISYVKGTLTITQADAVIVTANSYSRQYGEANPTFEYTSSGATLNGVPSITCEATATSAVGEYDIVISKGSVTNYNVTYVNGKLTVTKAPLTITAKSYTIKQGDALPTFEAEYAGFKNNETSSVLSTQPRITTTTTSTDVAGEYDINVSGAEAQNYDISYVKGKLIIEKVDVDPITETETTTFSSEMNESTDLSNTVIDNTYYSMNADNGDGYDATEQAIVLNSTTTTEQMNTVQNAAVGNAAIKQNFNGIIFEIAAGTGAVYVDVKTKGSHVLKVQIGKGAPTTITKTERETVGIDYNVSEPTYVYLYASSASGASAPLNRASAGANSVLLYGYKITPGSNTGIGVLTVDDMENGTWYTLEGRKLQGKPTAKGLYIINGRKVVVK